VPGVTSWAIMLFVYQFSKIRKLKLNPLRDEIFSDSRDYYIPRNPDTDSRMLLMYSAFTR